MASGITPCKTCGSETKVTTLGSFRGEAGPVAVTVFGMPALVCSSGHKRFPSRKFIARLTDLVADAEAVAPQPPAARRGLFRTRYHCHGCNAELPVTPAKKSECVLDASLEHLAPFKVIVQVALHKCEGCGLGQVLSNDEVAAGARKALAYGLRASGTLSDS
jgi:hypothetical protein